MAIIMFNKTLEKRLTLNEAALADLILEFKQSSSNVIELTEIIDKLIKSALEHERAQFDAILDLQARVKELEGKKKKT